MSSSVMVRSSNQAVACEQVPFILITPFAYYFSFKNSSSNPYPVLTVLMKWSTDSLKSRFAVIEFVSRMDAELAKLDVERAVKESEIKVGKEFTSTDRAASADLLRGESSTAMDMRTERIAALLPHDTQPATSVGSQVTKSLLTRKFVVYWYGSSAARRKMRPKDLEDSDDIPPSASVFYKFRTKVNYCRRRRYVNNQPLRGGHCFFRHVC